MMNVTVDGVIQKFTFTEVPTGSLFELTTSDKTYIAYKINTTTWCYFNNPGNVDVLPMAPLYPITRIFTDVVLS